MKQTVRRLGLLLSLVGICVGYALPLLRGRTEAVEGEAVDLSALTVVLDAGHGGEDGGAVSASGLQEKTVNLDLVLRLAALLEESGVKVCLTRDRDVLLYDRSTDYRGRKKALDLQARRQITERTPNAVFVSIHMNAFSQTKYRGLQVWYSPNDARSAVLADRIQATVRERLQPDNTRKTKSAGSNIYLLHHLTVPAVLVECGFLSNPDEAAMLAQEGYRQELAQMIFLGIAQGLRDMTGGA